MTRNEGGRGVMRGKGVREGENGSELYRRK